MSVSSECCVLLGRSFCDGPITRPEDFYRVWCVCDQGTLIEEAQTHQSCRAVKKPPLIYICVYFGGFLSKICFLLSGFTLSLLTYMCANGRLFYTVYIHEVSEMSRQNFKIDCRLRSFHVPLTARENTFCLYLCAVVRDRTLPVPEVCFGP